IDTLISFLHHVVLLFLCIPLSSHLTFDSCYLISSAPTDIYTLSLHDALPIFSSTTDRSDLVSSFSSEDLPTFGRPTNATRRGPASGSGPPTWEVCGNIARAASSRSPEPRPCRAETGYGSPSPRDHSMAASASPRWSSTLLATSRVGLFALRSRRTTRSSSSVRPTVASTTNSTASASSIAISACSPTRDLSPRVVRCQPPVSTTVKYRPVHSAW